VVAALLASLAAQAEPAPHWVEREHRKGVTVYSRSSPGTDVEEMLGVGQIPVPPAAAWAVLMNLDGYRNTMPFTVESRVVGEEEQGRVRYFYTVVSPPLISARDYTLRVAVEQTPERDKGHGRFTWSVANDYSKAPPPRPGLVRLELNSGFWDLTPTSDGMTRAILYLRTDPGGRLPGFVVDIASVQAIPGTFAALAKASSVNLPLNRIPQVKTGPNEIPIDVPIPTAPSTPTSTPTPTPTPTATPTSTSTPTPTATPTSTSTPTPTSTATPTPTPTATPTATPTSDAGH
jgi:hypothetical protein